MYRVNAKTYQEAYIDNGQIATILEEINEKLLGGSGRYIKDDGIIYEDTKYHTWHTEKICAAKEEDIVLNQSLKVVIKYLKSNSH